jgi:hypothetical protein
VALYSLGTLATYSEAKGRLRELGVDSRAERVAASVTDGTTNKYLARLLDKMR